MTKSEFKITGMTCNHCVNTVEGAVNALDGVEKVKVNLKKGEGSVKYDESKLDADKIAAAITESGYTAEVK